MVNQSDVYKRQVATTSMLFIIEAVALGFFLKYSKFNKWINTLGAIALLIVAIALRCV